MRLVALCLGLALLAMPAQAQDLDAPGALGSQVTITLTNGETLTGTLVDRTGLDITLDHPLLGEIPIPRTTIAIQPEEEDAGTEEVEDTHTPWSGTADLSINGASGNTDNELIQAQINMQRQDGDAVDSILFQANHTRQAEQDVPSGTPGVTNTGSKKTTQDRQFIRYRREWIVEESRWRPFFEVSDERDSNNAYHDLVTIAGGGTYMFLDEDDEEFAGRVGLAAARRFGSEDDDEWNPEGLLGLRYRLDISARQHLAAETTLYPTLDDLGAYRSISQAEWRMDLTDDDPWYIKIGMNHRYDSVKQPNTEKGDFWYYTGVGTVF